MAITVNSVALSNGMPSAPLRFIKLDVDLDASYPAGGYDVSDQLEGGTVVSSPTVPHYDGADLRWFKVTAAGMLVSLETANGAPGAETADTTDVSGHTGLIIEGVAVQ